LGDHVLDLILLLLLVLFAVSGYRQGFIVGLLSFFGFVGGGLVGMLIAPPLARAVVDGPAQQALLAIVIAFLAATLGQLLASSLGSVLRNRVTGNNARSADAAGGAVVSALSLLLVAWFMGNAAANATWAPVQHQVKNSAVLKTVNGVMPDAAQNWFNGFKQFISDNKWPQVFSGLGGEPFVDVQAPDDRILSTPALKATENSIVKIRGIAPSCQKRIEGTGFVYAPDRVMTNAHVVAGVQGRSQVLTFSGRELKGRVVLYDPRKDIAVLDVPGLGANVATPLKFDQSARSGDPAIVAGYPKDQSFTSNAARVRAKQIAKGADIYRSSTPVKREIYSIRGLVEPGNSGGPLISANGTVYGVIFAAALDDKQTGYALTAQEVSPDAQEGQSATNTVSTQQCSE
jgi:S1-C subfamily serine protease